MGGHMDPLEDAILRDAERPLREAHAEITRLRGTIARLESDKAALEEMRDDAVSDREALRAERDEARAVAEMAVSDECGIDTEKDVETHWLGEEVEPDEWCRRRLLELRQNVRDVQWMAVGDWRRPTIDRNPEPTDNPGV